MSTSLPGFMMLFGSKAFLMALMTFSSAAGVFLANSSSFLKPMPCSPLILPPRAYTRGNRSAWKALILSNHSSGVRPSRFRGRTWMLPSPMWAQVTQYRPYFFVRPGIWAVISGILSRGTTKSSVWNILSMARAAAANCLRNFQMRASASNSSTEPLASASSTSFSIFRSISSS